MDIFAVSCLHYCAGVEYTQLIPEKTDCVYCGLPCLLRTVAGFYREVEKIRNLTFYDASRQVIIPLEKTKKDEERQKTIKNLAKMLRGACS